MNEILIYSSERGYRVEFPYKPSSSAIRGFHSLKMVWQKAEGGVKWLIPADKLAEAIDFICYWFTEHPQLGRERYGVRVSEMAEEICAVPVILVKPQPEGFNLEGWQL